MLQNISLITAFSAGFLSFFAPCILPLIPPYFSWIWGISQDKLRKTNLKLKLFSHSLILVLGFSLMFIILGASAGKLSQIFSPYRLKVQRIGGLIIIIFGLNFSGFLKIFKHYKVVLINKLFSRLNSQAGSFFVGLTFAFAWVACFSPILGSILILASLQETLNEGIILLIFYSLGLAVPFLLASFFLGFLMEKVEVYARISKGINLLSGFILIALGILLMTDNFYKIVAWFNKIL